MTILAAGSYLLIAVAPDQRRSRLPIASAVLGLYGWSVCHRDPSQALRQRIFRTRDGAAEALYLLATARVGAV